MTALSVWASLNPEVEGTFDAVVVRSFVALDGDGYGCFCFCLCSGICLVGRLS